MTQEELHSFLYLWNVLFIALEKDISFVIQGKEKDIIDFLK
jgi:hypothetical protein